jgi:NTP pyrophosphatase (non-canonical NTP hydrolase)
MRFIPRPIIHAFAERMEQKLAANDSKEPWTNIPKSFLMECLEEEVNELRRALFLHESPNAIALEAADVANYAMMIASVYGDIGTTTDRGQTVEPPRTKVIVND